MSDSVKEQNMISVEDMAEIAMDYFPNVVVEDFHGKELVVQRIIPFHILSALTPKIVDACFDDESGEYQPEMLDFSMRIAVVRAYTNVELPDDIEEQYYILYGTDLWNMVNLVADPEQLQLLHAVVIDRIHTQNNANKVLFEKTMHSSIDAITNIVDRLDDLFSDVTTDDIRNMVMAIGADGVDEEKIVRAVIAEQNKKNNDTNDD